MVSQSITLNIPEHIFQRLQRMAQIIHQPLEMVVSQSILEKMLTDGLVVSLIMKYTGLSAEEIASLADEKRHNPTRRHNTQKRGVRLMEIFRFMQ